MSFLTPIFSVRLEVTTTRKLDDVQCKGIWLDISGLPGATKQLTVMTEIRGIDNTLSQLVEFILTLQPIPANELQNNEELVTALEERLADISEAEMEDSLLPLIKGAINTDGAYGLINLSDYLEIRVQIDLVGFWHQSPFMVDYMVAKNSTIAQDCLEPVIYGEIPIQDLVSTLKKNWVPIYEVVKALDSNYSEAGYVLPTLIDNNYTINLVVNLPQATK